MEVGQFNSDAVALERMMMCSIVEAVVMETLLAAQRSLACFLMATGTLLSDVKVLPKFAGTDERFPMDELHRRKQPVPENKDASDTDDDEEDDDEDDDQDDDDDVGDEDFSGEEDGDDDGDNDEGDPEDVPPANGNGGNDDEDDEDDEDEDDEDDDVDDEDEDEDEDEEDQPPAKKRK